MESDRSDTYLIITAPVKKQHAILERIGASDACSQCLCDNVYQATAEVHKSLSENALSDDAKLVIILAWADNLTLGQMEFFTLFKEHECVVTIAISNNNESKLQTALKAGVDRAMFLDNLKPGLFDTIVGTAKKRGRTPLIKDVSRFDENVYDLMDDIDRDELEEAETKIIEIPADKAEREDVAGCEMISSGDDEVNESEVTDSKELTDIALSEDELRSLLDED